jgi:tetratricopeptide (TPR) repeat protein
VNERKPRRPSDGIERAPRTGDSSRLSRGDLPPRQSRGGRDATSAGRRSKPARGSRATTGDTENSRARGARSTGRDDRRGRSSGRGGRRTEADDHRRSSRPAGGDDGRRVPRKGGARRADASERDGGRRKRTSRNSDERNPTRSGIDYPSPKYRAKQGGGAAPDKVERPALRKVKSRGAQSTPPERARKARKPKPAAPAPRRRGRRTEAGEELGRLAGRGARHAQADLARAAEAFAAGRERDAARLLRPLRDLYPDASSVRELLGLSQYRLGQYAAASKELEAFADLTGSVEQHPVLMDCARALGRHARVEELWEELAAASPSAALVSEGRIVLAGSRADQGRLHEAIATLDRRRGTPGRVQEHHVRVWYALADLYERAGEIPKARELFLRVRRHDAGFADVAERLAALN